MQEYLRSGVTAGGSPEDDLAQITELDSVVERGGAFHWGKWNVTGPDGIARSQSWAPDGSSPRPSLDGAASADLAVTVGSWGASALTELSFTIRGHHWTVSISGADQDVENLSHLIPAWFALQVDADLVPPPKTFKVFIGHGRDPQWKYLHRALIETHGFVAEAFESSERAGYHTLVVVDQMVRTSTVALIVMTGEDADADGNIRARENVVHEVGFCQGALGIANTIVIMEDGVSEPSNIAGLTQIRFPRGSLIDVEDSIVDALSQRRQAFEFEQR